MKPQEYERFDTLAELIDHLQATSCAGETKAAVRKKALQRLPQESAFQKDILDYMQDTLPIEVPGVKVKAFKLQAGPYMQGGLPDVWAVIKTPEMRYGKVFCFEVKRPYVGKASPLQKKQIAELIAAGAAARQVIYVNDVRRALTEHGIIKRRGL